MERVRYILQDKEYQRHLGLNAEAETKRIYCKHDFQHALAVARLAYLMLLEQKEAKAFGKESVYAAGLLHDIGRWLEYSTGEDHCQASARLAEPILHRAGFNASEINGILKAIKQHRFPESPLAVVLAKADDLSRDCYGCPSKQTCYKADQMMEKFKYLEF